MDLTIEFGGCRRIESKQLARILAIQEELENRTCLGKKWLGWLNGPSQLTKSENKFLKNLKSFSTLVIVGIGGSVNGSRGLIELLSYQPKVDGKKIIYAGFDLDIHYYRNLVKKLRNRNDWGLLIISKSGNTFEIQKISQLLSQLINDQNKIVDKHSYQRTFLVTEESSTNPLLQRAQQEDWQVIHSQPNIGGRFSLLSEVGLIPCGYAGIDLAQLIRGAKDMRQICLQEKYQKNYALQLTHFRFTMMQLKKTTEAFSFFTGYANHFAEWIKQLFAETEGKDGKGVWPLNLHYSKDLHSIGQMLQDGPRNIYEIQTIFNGFQSNHGEIDASNYSSQETIQKTKDDIDIYLKILAKDQNRLIHAVQKARQLGNVPLAIIRIPEISAYHLGGLVYLFQYTCSLTALLLDLNPFNQPGVEAYKKILHL